MAEYRVNTFDGKTWTFSEPMSETDARAEAINQNGTIADDFEDDGYDIRYLQIVLDGPDGEVAIVEIEPV